MVFKLSLPSRTVVSAKSFHYQISFHNQDPILRKSNRRHNFCRNFGYITLFGLYCQYIYI
ncbi:uncharacterized protein PHALS_14687 [Plasmopara halstedii]|uniref:Uncharacterized protein n=1 Tax=Plasmopara halstedii TaxID=4781 RepID=A0A0P1APM3_PLAHL|nr:uncharacterized protein PHALS_14687 [Plasmopara halstedii]CEG43148.1 hypothetical protein PHALS_14687 [Plasmopara halstedii]|eukprot:XP_024579517.1 hypothetical protein PHALS_14687 [Plasmopara halstedii]